MTVRIVTDSGSDIGPEDAKKFGITVVPNYVHFGDTAYRDGIDINTEEFYKKLAASKTTPHTAAASPGEFVRVYDDLCREADAIVSIHITRKHSSVLESALLGKQMSSRNGCHIEVMDSGGVTIWQGLVAIAAAKIAEAGGSLQQVKDKVHETINNLSGLGLLSTLKYVIGGGRISGTIFRVESMLPLKALLTIRDYEVKPVRLVRNWAKGMERLHEFIRTASVHHIHDIAIGYNTSSTEADKLIGYINQIIPDCVPHIFKIGPTLGTHTGPETLMVGVVKASEELK